MKNDDNNKSSRINTTPFNNHYENALNRINRERSSVTDNRSIAKSNGNLVLSDAERKQKANEYANSALPNQNNNINENKNINNNRNSSNQSGNEINNLPNKNRFGQGSTANNLRNKLNTIPSNLDDAKKKAVEKGTEALKKSANPLAKAAGYGLGAYQKHKNKKEQDEKNKEESSEEDKDENDENQDATSESKQTTEERRKRKLIKKMLPIIGICASLLMILLVLLAVISPIITVSSWFTSLFHHNSDDASSYTIYNEKDSENYKAEQDYNNAILGSKDGSVKGIIPEYQEKYGVTIDWYLLNALITYKYTSDNGNLYSSDNTEEIDEEELNKRLEELEKKEESESTENESTSSDNSGVDFSAASKKIKAFASLMVVKENGSYTTDIEKEGKVYNNVLNSSTFKKYYKSMFKDDSEEAHKLLLDQIYDFAEMERELHKSDSATNGGVISDTSIVHLQTCGQPYKTTQLNGLTIHNNPLTNEGTNYPDYLNLSDYIKGTLMTEVQNYLTSDYKEGLKALGIVVLSFMLNDSRSGFNLKSGEMYFPTGNCRQVTCDPTNGCTYLTGRTSGIFGTAFVGLNRFGSNSGQHKPLTEEQNAVLDEVVKEIFGKVIVKKGVTAESFSGSKDVQNLHHYSSFKISDCIRGKCLPQEEEMADAKNGMDYMSILNKYFTDVPFDVIDITEGLYYKSNGENINGTAASSSGGLNEAFHYHQGNYKSTNSFCEGGTISARGCSVTSTAIAVSILTGEKHDPLEISSRLRSSGKCNGNRVTYPASAATLYNLNSYTVNKKNTDDVNKMLKDLANGNTVVVARINKNAGRYKTSNGHYIALVGVKTENGVTKVLVWDPGSTSESRDNYWADFNDDILKPAHIPSFVVLSRR